MNLNTTYSFITLAPTVLGNAYEMQRVIGIMTVKEAVKISDVYTLQNSLNGLIVNLPDIKNCTFILFESEHGTTTLLAKEWIDETSIKTVKNVDIEIKISDVTTEDIGIIRSKLMELGYRKFKIDMK